ncbi:ly6/PLAUR domain-containing protein 6 isoform X2 [Narcine bancroftii]|uniref:ly6/PLAUR domain-containing protein 6 isoform X2 n=1 Tax=Narcine bancroftii TaxID=1343680 RepID=UPI003831BD7F
MARYFLSRKVASHWVSACSSQRRTMEAWPGLAWVLLMSLIADCLKQAQTREFTVKDIIYLHPSTTPYPGGFKCFTCENAADNYECNRWAPDVYCPRETHYCYTRHKMNANGDSSLVTKRCVSLKDCLSVGCTQPDYEGYKMLPDLLSSSSFALFAQDSSKCITFPVFSPSLVSNCIAFDGWCR